VPYTGKHRTFVAVELPETVRRRAADLTSRLALGSGRVKWVEPENLHVTLKFLGDVETTDLPEICSGVRAACGGINPFEMVLGGAGAFPRKESPRIVWLGLTDGAESMKRLYSAIDAELGQLGYRGEQRQFTPHVTLGRIRTPNPTEAADLGQRIVKAASFEAGPAPVTEVVVFSSHLSRQGPRYEVVGRCPLGNPAT